MPPRFPHFKQLDASDCGPASLRMIARFYGIAYSAEMLRKHCHISRYGVTMRGIDECAQYIGFEIPNEFVVGYGLDYVENYRNLPYVGILKEEVYTK